MSAYQEAVEKVPELQELRKYPFRAYSISVADDGSIMVTFSIKEIAQREIAKKLIFGAENAFKRILIKQLNSAVEDMCEMIIDELKADATEEMKKVVNKEGLAKFLS